MDAGAEIDEQSSSKNDDEQPSSGSEAEKAAIRKGDDEVWSIHEEDGSEEDNEGEPNRSANEGKDECSEDVLKGEEEVQLRKSTRVKKPALVSPWVTTMTKKRTKDDKHKEALFQLCTTRPNKEDAQELFVEMYDYFVTRGELYCLRERGWINNRFMSMVARTLVGDQLQNSSRVSRHIFSSELMEKMSSDPKKWSWQAHEYEILPEHIRYNIGDCDLIFAPTLRLDHWFCYVLDTKTLRFSVLDSLVDQLTYARLQKREEDALLEDEKTSKKKRLSQKQQEELRGKERLGSQCRDCIISVLRRVKPELFGKGREIPKDINWPKVHVQADIDSCGVHVLSWLFGWDGSAQDKGGYTMPKLSPEQIRQIKVDSLWWLVTHDRNIHAKKVLSIAGDKKQMQGNRDK